MNQSKPATAWLGNLKYSVKRTAKFMLLFGVTVLFTVSCTGTVQLPSESIQSQHTQVEKIAVISEFQATGIDTFVKAGLQEAIARYGQPRIPVQTVLVKPDQSAFITLEDAAQGRFSIHLGRKPSEYAFAGQLGHEISHLLNARLFDCYVEGQSTLFSEQFLRQQGLDWSGWEQYFRQEEEPFYSKTYFLMRELSGIVGAEAMQRFLSFAIEQPSDPPWMYIDINRWLASLPANLQLPAKVAILRQFEAMNATLTHVDPRYRCERPA